MTLLEKLFALLWPRPPSSWPRLTICPGWVVELRPLVCVLRGPRGHEWMISAYGGPSRRVPCVN